MTFGEYSRIKATMEHVMIVLNAAKEHKEADKVDRILFRMLLDYDKVPISEYIKKFEKYISIARSCDKEHMKGYYL